MSVIQSRLEKTWVKVKCVVAASGTALRLTDWAGVTIPNNTFASRLFIQARLVAGDNAGAVFVGDEDLEAGVSELFELASKATITIEHPDTTKFDVHDIFIDADNNNDGVVGWYIPV